MVIGNGENELKRSKKRKHGKRRRERSGREYV